MRLALLLLLVLSLSFAGELWKVDTGAGVNTQPLIYGSRVIVGTEDGKVYSVEPPFVKWSYNALEPVVSDPVYLGAQIIVPTENKIVALNQYGALQWEAELPGITGVAVSDKIYVADQNGIQALNADGSLAWNFAPGAEDELPSAKELIYPLTTPLATANYVVFGYDDYVYAIRTNGQFFWKSQIGHLWDTPPTIIANTLYTGTAEGILYELDMFDGKIKSQTNFFEQITTTPVGQLGTIIIGTSSNNLYGIAEGKVKWAQELDGKVSSKMLLPGAGDALYLTTTRSLYGISPTEGTILFKHSFIDWPSSPAYLNGQLIVGTQEGKLYGIDSSKACSILYPEMDSQIGNAELVISGLGYSKSGNPQTQLRINGGEWISFNSTEWEYNWDPSTLPYGLVDLECRVTDATGSETEPYTTISLVHVDETTTQLMTISYPTQVRAETEFEITAVDSEGAPIRGVEVTIAGKSYSGDGSISLSLPSGLYTGIVERAGYQTEEIAIDSKADPTLAYAAAGLFVVGLIIYVYFGFIRKPKKKKLIFDEKHSEELARKK